jgi:arginine vasopressin
MSPNLVPSFTHVAVSVLITVVVISSTVTDACFIRNCPKGGKRSLESAMVPKRECMKCGLRGAGQCVGPRICCSTRFGCHFGTSETEVCQQENQFETPCFVTGDVCGANDSGRCVADGVCCDSDSCADNEKCRQNSDFLSEPQSNASKEDILQLLQKLLGARSDK